jgi:hypothetical protein
MEQQIKCFNEDIIELINSNQLQNIFINKEKSLIYIDPPYGGSSSDYPKLYSFLEEYIHMKPLNEIEKIQKFNRYAKQKGYEEQFIELLDVLHKSNLFNIWVLSYNESSWKPIEEIVTLLKKYKSNIIVKKREYQYNYRKNEEEIDNNIDIDGNIFQTKINKGKRIGYEFLIICKN